MSRFKVVVATLDTDELPEWVAQELKNADIDLVQRECASREDVQSCAADADIVWLFGGSRCLIGNLDVLKRCGAIIRTGSGTDNVPVDEATRRGIVVVNTPEAISEIVAEHAIALLFAVIREIPVQDRAVRQGVWDRDTAMPKYHVSGETLGVIGFGHIARAVVRKLSGFKMRVIVADPFVDDSAMAELGAEKADFDTVLSEAQFLTVHVPLVESTRQLIGAREFGLMKPSAVFVNTSRGPVVDETALYEALSSGQIAAAAIDVTEKEPPNADNPLLQLPNIVVTPHIAAYSDIQLERLWRFSVDSVLDLANGRWPRSYVNHDVKPKWDLT